MFSKQASIGWSKEGSQEKDASATPVALVWETPPCAWCLRERGLELGNGSHGICPEHADAILQQYRERRTRH